MRSVSRRMVLAATVLVAPVVGCSETKPGADTAPPPVAPAAATAPAPTTTPPPATAGAGSTDSGGAVKDSASGR